MLPNPSPSYVEVFLSRGITVRQIEVIVLVMEGLSNSAIALQLHITVDAIVNHLWLIYKILPEIVPPKRLNLVLLAQRGGR